MSAAVLSRRWACAARHCTSEAVTVDGKMPMHRCGQTHGLLVPLTPAGVRAEHRPTERGDWVGREIVQTDARGRPVMSTVTVRDDGQDCTVYAPLAVATGDEVARG